MDAFVITEDVVDCVRHIDALCFVHRLIFVDPLVLLAEKVLPVEATEELNEA